MENGSVNGLNNSLDVEKVKDFFNKCAPLWDAEMIRNDRIIRNILDAAHITKGSRVLDIACGTGVLTPDYLERDVAQVVGVDISPEMIKIASGKFTDPRVSFICGDAQTADVGNDYDAVMIYNAFPHFADQKGIIKTLSEKLKQGGTLTIAHGMSKAKIDAHHSGCAHAVSLELPEADVVADMMSPYLKVQQVVSNDEMYMVVAVR